MRLPRDVGAQTLAAALARYGYSVTRQTGSHIRLTTIQGGEHYITIPNHNPIRLGTLNHILTDIAAHFRLSKDRLAHELFG